MKNPLEKMAHPAYCGFDCGECPVYKATAAGDAEKKRELAEKFSSKDRIISPESIFCMGCKSDIPSGHAFCSTCSFRKCASEKKIECCGDCISYPCGDIEIRFPCGCRSREILDAFRKYKETNPDD